MPEAYWVICHRSNVAKTYESGLSDRTVVIEFEDLAKAIAGLT